VTFLALDKDLELQHNLLTALADLPPSGYLAAITEQDQMVHWDSIKGHFQALHDCLKAFFNGQPDPEIEPQGMRDFYLAERSLYVQFYGLIQVAWHGIKKIADSLKFEIPATPGEALIKVLEQRADKMVAPIFERHHTISIKSARSVLSTSESMLHLANEEKRRELTKSEKRKLNKYQKDKRQFIDLDGSITMDFFCLACCEKLAKSDRSIKNQIRLYETAKENHLKALMPLLRDVKGGTWKDGRFVTNP
jgi:hypothetical protein